MDWDGNDDMNYNWEDDYSNNILIYGDSKVGKTYVGAYKLKQLLDSDTSSIAYVINTDKGFAKPAMLHKLNDSKYENRIVYYYVNSMKKAIDVINEIRVKVRERNNPNDIVMFDLLSWIWDQSQKEFISDISGGEVVGFLTRVMKDSEKFGTFTGLQWQYVKKLDDMVSNYLSRNPICNVIAIARNKNVEVEYKMKKKAEDIWFDVGRPDSRKDIAFEFANIIKVEKFVKDEEIFRRFIIMGARDYDPDYKYYAYSTAENFWLQVDCFIGLDEVKPKLPRKTDKERASEIVLKVKEAFSESEGFSIGAVGEMFPEVNMNFIEKVLGDGVTNGKVFKIKDDVYSLKEPEDKPIVEKKVVVEPKVETPVSEEPILGLTEVISVTDFMEFLKNNYGESDISIKELMVRFIDNNESRDFEEDDIIDVTNRCLEDGLIHEPNAGHLKIGVAPVEEEEEEIVEDDDDW